MTARRLLIIALLAPVLALAARGAETSDSLARALAVYWASGAAPETLSAAERESFARGFADYYSTTDSLADRYLRGAMMAGYINRSLGEAAQMGLTVDRQAVGRYLVSALKGEQLGFTPQQASDFIDLQVAPEEAREFSAQSQAAFIADAAAQPGAVTTPSGLVFEVITEGEGVSPVDGQTVMVSYTGRLSDGSQFDATEAPIALTLGRVVPGFDEGLKMMKPGGRYRIVIPSDLGYGDRGVRGVIPGGAALDFTIDLIEVKPLTY